MHVFSVLFKLHLPSTSLKGKRGIIKSLLARARNSFNVAAAEVDLQDLPGTAVLAFVTVSENRALARRLLERLEEWVVEERPIWNWWQWRSKSADNDQDLQSSRRMVMFTHIRSCLTEMLKKSKRGPKE